MDSPALDQKPSPASYADFSAEKSGVLKTVLQFVAIPLLIVGVAVGGFLGISALVGGGPKTVLDFVDLLRSDTVNRRRQAAFELASRLATGTVPEEFRDPRLVSALGAALEAERKEPRDPPEPAVLILRIFSLLRDPATLPAAREAARDPHPWIRSHALPVLGVLKDEESRPYLDSLCSHPDDPSTRQAALAALAILDQRAGEPFRLSDATRARAEELVKDRHEDVRFQAAILLARAGVAEPALPAFRQMLDRAKLGEFDFDRTISGIDRRMVQTNLVLQALDALRSIPGAAKDPGIEALLRRLADDATEGEPEVRQRARLLLQNRQ